MTAVAVEISPRPVEEPTTYPTSPEPTGLVIVDDVEALTEGTAAACNDDNPYR